MKYVKRCVIICCAWLILNLIFSIVIIVKGEDRYHDGNMKLLAWYLSGTIVYFLIAGMIAWFAPRNIAKEYIKMSNEMALDDSCLSPMEQCEKSAYKDFRGDPTNTKKAMAACIGKQSESKCTDRLKKRCREMMKSKGREYLEEFERFAKTQSTKETLGLCKGMAENNK